MDKVSQPPDYDAFGEPVVGGPGPVSSTRFERRVAVTVFWSVALLLIAGRIYQNGSVAGPNGPTMEIASR